MIALGLLCLAVMVLALGGFHPGVPSWWSSLTAVVAAFLAAFATLVAFGVIPV